MDRPSTTPMLPSAPKEARRTGAGSLPSSPRAGRTRHQWQTRHRPKTSPLPPQCFEGMRVPAKVAERHDVALTAHESTLPGIETQHPS